MRSSPPMPEEIEAGFYPGFERGWRRVELVGRVVMLGVVAATVAGLLGGGPVSLWTRKIAAGPLEVEYAPVVRFGTPTGLVVRATAPPGQDRVAISLAPDVVGKYGLQSVYPQPIEWQTDGAGEIRMLFALQPGTREAVVQIGGMPAGNGVVRLSARVDGGPLASWSQLVLP